MSVVTRKAQTAPKRVVFSEGEERKIILAATRIQQEHIAVPILLGRAADIRSTMKELRVTVPIDIVDPATSERIDAYAAMLRERRQRKGITLREASTLLSQPNYFGAMMVQAGDADAFVAGLTYHYPDVIRPALEVIGPAPDVSRVAGLYVMITNDGRAVVLTDPTVNIDPTVEQLADIAIMAADRAARSGSNRGWRCCRFPPSDPPATRVLRRWPRLRSW
jgi:malate dehydrogenase (oxaloacetate-decarboxylating)(NADP+)